jgi:ubiquitin-conjugating enzyme E2 J2
MAANKACMNRCDDDGDVGPPLAWRGWERGAPSQTASCAGRHRYCCATRRLQKEYRALQREPLPHVTAHPSPASLLEWHFVLEGDVDTDFRGGVYHGKIVFPPTYPFNPPSLSLYTPNGRFSTGVKLCLSMTDYHPESWNPLW